ncbi:MAG: DinB family protein, partial [Vulcanimicrobiaceae bacterium]
MTPRTGQAHDLRDAGNRSLAIVHAFNARGLVLPQIASINPPLWEFGHVAWFTEYWVLRHATHRDALRADGDALFDSATVAHRLRWELPLPSFEETVAFADRVRTQACDVLAEARRARVRYFGTLAVFHEDMHGEAALMTAQSLR